MKILFVSPSGSFGGGEAYLINVIKQLCTTYDVECNVILANSFLATELSCYAKTLDFISPCEKLSLNSYYAIKKINSHIYKNQPDLVFLNGLPEIGVLCKYINTNKIVVACHSNEFWLREPFFTLNFKRVLKRIVTHGFYKNINKFIAINKQVVESLSYLPLDSHKRQVALLYSGVESFDLSTSKRDINTVTFGRISRLCEGKGNEMLLRAFGTLKDKYNNIRLVISGDGEQMLLLKSLSRQLKISEFVHFTGMVDKEDFFSNIDCMVSPSDMEALPLVILESFSCGIPVISTDVGGVSELLTDSYNGKLIPPKSESALVEAMEDYILNSSKYFAYAKNAKSDFERKYKLEIFGLNLYRELKEVVYG